MTTTRSGGEPSSTAPKMMFVSSVARDRPLPVDLDQRQRLAARDRADPDAVISCHQR
jgi:hypothetical protein